MRCIRVYTPQEAAKRIVRDALTVFDADVWGPSTDYHAPHLRVTWGANGLKERIAVTCDNFHHGHSVAASLRDPMLVQLMAEGAWAT